MLLTITICVDNAAFDEPSEEVERILVGVAKYVEASGVDMHFFPMPLKDINGNRVGQVELIK